MSQCEFSFCVLAPCFLFLLFKSAVYFSLCGGVVSNVLISRTVRCFVSVPVWCMCCNGTARVVLTWCSGTVIEWDGTCNGGEKRHEMKRYIRYGILWYVVRLIGEMVGSAVVCNGATMVVTRTSSDGHSAFVCGGCRQVSLGLVTGAAQWVAAVIVK